MLQYLILDNTNDPMHLRLYLLHVPIYISLYTCMHMTNGKSSQGSQQRTYDTQFAKHA